MKKFYFAELLLIIGCVFAFDNGVFAQNDKTPPVKTQEISEADGVPVLIKHLPDWENARKGAVLAHSVNDLRQSLGERPVFDLIDFAGGTEAVTAVYPQGKLLIVEYTNPQESIETDAKTAQRLAENNQNIFYKRTGNYNLFVFDAPDAAAANSLIEQVKYEKTVQWLRTDPTLLHRAERYFINTTTDIFVSTVLIILIVIGFAIVSGLIVGIVYFYYRDRRRLAMNAFSDAGGMTRLNLDGLSADDSGGRYLSD